MTNDHTSVLKMIETVLGARQDVSDNYVCRTSRMRPTRSGGL